MGNRLTIDSGSADCIKDAMQIKSEEIGSNGLNIITCSMDQEAGSL